MGYMLREFEEESKFSQELTLEAIGQAVPIAEIKAAIQEEGAQETRERKLNMVAVVFLVIAMNIYTHLCIGHVMKKVAQGLRFIWRDPDYKIPKDSAISYRRYLLGARPVVNLFHRVCRPMATPETPGAFLFGLRVMAIDGTIENVADTAENVAVFGRHCNDRSESAFPQIRCVYLAECDTHAIVDAGVWPCHTGERVGGFRVLRSVEAGTLVMWDRGFHDFDMFVQVRKRDAQVLSRLPANVKPQRVRTLMAPTWLICSPRLPSSQAGTSPGAYR